MQDLDGDQPSVDPPVNAVHSIGGYSGLAALILLAAGGPLWYTTGEQQPLVLGAALLSVSLVTIPIAERLEGRRAIRRSTDVLRAWKLAFRPPTRRNEWNDPAAVERERDDEQ